MGPSQAKQQSSDHIASIPPSAVAFLENTKALNVIDQTSIILVDARALGLWIQVLCEGRMDSSSSQHLPKDLPPQGLELPIVTLKHPTDFFFTSCQGLRRKIDSAEGSVRESPR